MLGLSHTADEVSLFKRCLFYRLHIQTGVLMAEQGGSRLFDESAIHSSSSKYVSDKEIATLCELRSLRQSKLHRTCMMLGDVFLCSLPVLFLIQSFACWRYDGTVIRENDPQEVLLRINRLVRSQDLSEQS
jgi:hypothetical protein